MALEGQVVDRVLATLLPDLLVPAQEVTSHMTPRVLPTHTHLEPSSNQQSLRAPGPSPCIDSIIKRQETDLLYSEDGRQPGAETL